MRKLNGNKKLQLADLFLVSCPNKDHVKTKIALLSFKVNSFSYQGRFFLK